MGSRSRGHLDFRDDSYRGTYWNQPPSAADRMANSGNAVRTEKLRQEKLKSAYGLARHDPGFQSVPDGVNARLLRNMYDGSSMFQSMETGGTIRSLPTNIIDRPDTVNVNHIRAKRQEAVWSNYYDGTRTFVPKTCNDNWVEERFDNMYRSGSSELFEKRRYVSTSKDTLRDATVAYTKAEREKGMVARLPVDGFDHRSTFRRRFGPANYINYARDDYTLDNRSKGGFWVGTAPVNMYQTMNMTSFGQSKAPEFQARNRWTDTRSRMLCTLKPDRCPEPSVLEKYRSRWPSGGLGARRSQYKEEYQSFANNKYAPQMSDKLQPIHKMVTNITDAGVQGHGHFTSGLRH